MPNIKSVCRRFKNSPSFLEQVVALNPSARHLRRWALYAIENHNSPLFNWVYPQLTELEVRDVCLTRAAAQGQQEMISTILRDHPKGASFCRAMFLAARNGRAETVEMLWSHYQNHVHMFNSSEWAVARGIMQGACVGDQLELLQQWLLKRSKDPDYTDHLIPVCSSSGSERCLAFLLRNNASLETWQMAARMAVKGYHVNTMAVVWNTFGTIDPVVMKEELPNHLCEQLHTLIEDNALLSNNPSVIKMVRVIAQRLPLPVFMESHGYHLKGQHIYPVLEQIWSEQQHAVLDKMCADERALSPITQISKSRRRI